MTTGSRSRYILAIDEFGFLGYADHDERFPGEFGLAAGVLYSPSSEELIERSTTKAGFQPRPGGKLHITDLDREQQERLRDHVSDLVESEDLVLFYSAVSAAGYHGEHRRRQELSDRADKARRSPVKLSGTKNFSADRLLEEVYRNVILDAIAWCNDRHGGDYHLTVRSDRTEAALLADLESAIITLLKPAHREVKHQSGFDPRTRAVVTGTVAHGWKLPAAFEITCRSDHLTIDTTPLPTATALLPDTVASWIAYHLKTRVETDPNAPLNDPTALPDFPLKSRIYRFTQNVSPHIADTLLSRTAAKRNLPE